MADLVKPATSSTTASKPSFAVDPRDIRPMDENDPAKNMFASVGETLVEPATKPVREKIKDPFMPEHYGTNYISI